MVPWKNEPYETFPADLSAPEGMRTLSCDRTMLTVQYYNDVEYAVKNGLPLHLQLLLPFRVTDPKEIFPLAVYVQGSAWMRQQCHGNLPALAAFAARGFAVAVVEYRHSSAAPFPAQVQDAKTAIRFLRRHAEEYRIDPERIALWGDSSGGHTALIAGFTGDERLPGDTEESYALYEENSAGVKAIVDYYGPTDLSEMNNYPSTMDHQSPLSPEGMVLGKVPVLEHPDRVKAANPVTYLKAGIPPLLILHGNKDRLVPFSQSVLLYEAMRRMDLPAEFYRLDLADHGGPEFWAPAALDLVETFLRRAFG